MGLVTDHLVYSTKPATKGKAAEILKLITWLKGNLHYNPIPSKLHSVQTTEKMTSDTKKPQQSVLSSVSGLNQK